MAQGFKLVQRPSKPGVVDSEKKFYAVSKNNGTSGLKHLCKMIAARSTVSSADVKDGYIWWLFILLIYRLLF